MGLRKAIESDSGSIANYWKIYRIIINIDENNVWYKLSGYVNKKASDEKKKPLLEYTYVINDINVDSITRSILYTDAKTRDILINSQDE